MKAALLLLVSAAIVGQDASSQARDLLSASRPLQPADARPARPAWRVATIRDIRASTLSTQNTPRLLLDRIAAVYAVSAFP